MNKTLKAISANNDLDFYLNPENPQIQSQELILVTKEYFESGQRSGYFEPLDFLNLLWKQANFVRDNFDKPDSTIKTLKALPLTSEQKHIFYGFLLKWFGGYPVEKREYFEPSKQKMVVEPEYIVLKLIEKEFLAFDGETPEKEFCQKTKKITKTFEPNETKHPKPILQLKLSDKSGAKIDLIRVLNALYELHYFQNEKGDIPTKQKYFEAFGEFLGTDFSKYHTNLSQALKNQPLEVNLKVFEEMKKATQKVHYQEE